MDTKERPPLEPAPPPQRRDVPAESKPGEDAAAERGERIETGKSIARGGRESERAPDEAEHPP